MVAQKDKLTISIVGDSFSSDSGELSWITMLSENYNIKNFSQRGISQYRLHTLVTQNLQALIESNFVIIFHTNPDRVYVPDHVEFSARKLTSHTHCDLVATTALQDPTFKYTADSYYRCFFDEAQQNLFYNLLVKDIQQLTCNVKTVHCSGFETGIVKSFDQLLKQHRGATNHYDKTGNCLVYNYICDQINETL
jgi:hypothetical protein